MKKLDYTVDNTIVVDTKMYTGTGEVDFEMYDDVLGSDKVEKAYEENGVYTIDKGELINSYPVKIEILRQFLDEAEKTGCNYVAIDYNCDHPDYTFYGVEVRVATQAEIDEEFDKQKKERQAKADKLLAQAQKEAERLMRD